VLRKVAKAQGKASNDVLLCILRVFA